MIMIQKKTSIPVGDPIPASQLIASRHLRVAFLLSLAGGFLDAYTYVARGGVYANTQTGNVVKLGLVLAGGAYGNAIQFVVPLLTFSLGIICAMAVESAIVARKLRWVRRAVLAIEVALLLVVCAIPLDPALDLYANAIVSFVAAMQAEAFRSFRSEAVATIMSTGNVRKAAEELYTALALRDMAHVGAAVSYASNVVLFCCGAAAGYLVTTAVGRWAVLVPVALCIATFVVISVLLGREEDQAQAHVR